MEYLKKKGCTIEEIKGCLKDFIDKDYMRLLKPEEISHDSRYLAFFPVVNRSKESTQVRLVFDAAAKYGGKSLNDEILTGPNLLQPFLKVFFRFRLRKFGFIGDVSQMFLRIKLSEADRPYLRIVFPDPQSDQVQDYEVMVGLFGLNNMNEIIKKV